MNIQELFDYTRASLDSDESELPDALLFVWERSAEYRISERLGGSRSFRTSSVNASVASQAYIDLTTSTLFSVDQVNGPDWQLLPIEHREAQRRWPLNVPAGTPGTTGSPTHWSVDPDDDGSGVTLWLWPAPNAVENFTVFGAAAMTDPETFSASSIANFPTEFHPLIGEYMVARGAEMQANVAMAAMKMNRFEGELDILQRKWNRPSVASTATLGGARSRTDEGHPARLRYSWE